MVLGIKKDKLKQQVQPLGYSLLLAHFFIALGRDDAFWGLFLMPAYYQDLAFVSIIVYMVSQVILLIWKKLDHRHAWRSNFKKRLVYQLLAGVMLPTLLSFLLVYGYMGLILKQAIAQTTYFYYELPVSMLIILMLNLILGLQYALREKSDSPLLPPAPTPLMVQSGNTQLLIDPGQILLAEKDESLCFVYTQNKKRYTYPHSLDLLSQQLPSGNFFRTNRQTVTHRSNCLSFETERSGKLILTLHYPSPKTIAISQKKAKEFKSWLKGDQMHSLP
jgi:hypothetical protein